MNYETTLLNKMTVVWDVSYVFAGISKRRG